METAVIGNTINTGHLLEFIHSVQVSEPKKMSFEEACAECNAVTIETFINELEKRVKDRYRNEKS